MNLRTLLEDGLTLLSLSLNDNQIDLLLRYQAMMTKWNKSYNLTSITDPSLMVTRHLLDSIAITPIITGDHLIDVGAGGGLPGIPLAITFPDRQITLLDSNGKKTRFLFQVAVELGLKNITVEHKRAEDFYPQIRYEGVLTRAVSSIENIIRATDHLLLPQGKFWMMKGEYPKQELSVLGKDYKVLNIIKLNIPGLEEERHLIEIIRTC